jgi:two-component system NarL family response regulator
MSITVLLVDDQEIYRSAIRAHLDRMPEVKVLGEALDGESALRLTAELRPDVVVVDLFLPDLDGVEVMREIKRARPDTGLVALSGMTDDPAMRERALTVGACELLDKATDIDRVVPAIVSAAGGRTK